MPRSLRNILWAIGLFLTIAGLIFAIIMKNFGVESTALLFLPFIGIVLVLCLLFSGLIQDIVSEILLQLQANKQETQQSKDDTQDMEPPAPLTSEENDKAAAKETPA